MARAEGNTKAFERGFSILAENECFQKLPFPNKGTSRLLNGMHIVGALRTLVIASFAETTHIKH